MQALICYSRDYDLIVSILQEYWNGTTYYLTEDW